MVARVGEAIKKEMVLERMEDDKKEEKGRTQIEQIQLRKVSGSFGRRDNCGGEETEEQIEEEICSLELLGYVFDFPLRLIGSLVLTAEGQEDVEEQQTFWSTIRLIVVCWKDMLGLSESVYAL